MGLSFRHGRGRKSELVTAVKELFGRQLKRAAFRGTALESDLSIRSESICLQTLDVLFSSSLIRIVLVC